MNMWTRICLTALEMMSYCVLTVKAERTAFPTIVIIVILMVHDSNDEQSPGGHQERKINRSNLCV